MTRLRRLLPCCLALLLGCDTTPDDPLGHYAYTEPLRDLRPLFAAWDRHLDVTWAGAYSPPCGPRV
jgi:hypothetical protein